MTYKTQQHVNLFIKTYADKFIHQLTVSHGRILFYVFLCHLYVVPPFNVMFFLGNLQEVDYYVDHYSPGAFIMP